MIVDHSFYVSLVVRSLFNMRTLILLILFTRHIWYITHASKKDLEWQRGSPQIGQSKPGIVYLDPGTCIREFLDPGIYREELGIIDHQSIRLHFSHEMSLSIFSPDRACTTAALLLYMYYYST